MVVLDKLGRSVQVQMEGMPVFPNRIHVSPIDLHPGKSVRYVGHLSGGPKYGSNGVVRDTLVRGALVDLGLAGTWRIPFHFLVSITKVA